jgi:lysophospholipase L1-like esterase
MSQIKSLVIVAFVTLVLLVLIESVSWYVLSSNDKALPFLIDLSRDQLNRHEHEADRFTALDPHLGYAHGDSDASVRSLDSSYTWTDGFVVYAGDLSDLARPVILTLGGSTTDGVNYGHSWPEELQKTINKRGQTATVINGGTGGYSTNQELIKLLRDGLTFLPDVVISYSGVNDRGKFSEMPHPMVHPYQRRIIEALTAKQRSVLLPNTIAVLKALGGDKSAQALRYTFGVESGGSQADQFRRNMELMHAVSQSQGASFYGFIQANAFFNSRHRTSVKKAKDEEKYVKPLLALYREISILPQSVPFLHDATGILEPYDGVYKDDGVHVTQEGDRVIAEYIYSIISDEIRGTIPDDG